MAQLDYQAKVNMNLIAAVGIDNFKFVDLVTLTVHSFLRYIVVIVSFCEHSFVRFFFRLYYALPKNVLNCMEGL
jgi:hypothetical protein